MAYPKHIVAVMGIVRNAEGQILLIQSPRRGWEPPGGQVENGEDLFVALEREILEESGIVIKTGKLVAVYSNIACRPETKLMFTFTATACGGTLATSRESLAVGWFWPQEALQKVTHPAQKLKVEDALNGDPVIYRVYQTRPFRLTDTKSI